MEGIKYHHGYMPIKGKQCNVCGKKAHKHCSECQAVNYCSRECQVIDWKTHKETCKYLNHDVFVVARKNDIYLPALCNHGGDRCVAILAKNKGNLYENGHASKCKHTKKTSDYMTISVHLGNSNRNEQHVQHAVKMENEIATVQIDDVVDGSMSFRYSYLIPGGPHEEEETKIIKQCQMDHHEEHEMIVTFTECSCTQVVLRYGVLFTCSMWIENKQHSFATYLKDTFQGYVSAILNPNNHYRILYKGNAIKLKGKSVATYFMSKISMAS